MNAALYLGAIAFSALIGSVTTVVHQASASVANVSLPWGLVLSLAIVVSWFIGLTLLKSPRWVLISSGAAFLLMVFTLSQRGPGGSVLVPESWQGNTWVLLVPLVVIVIVLWPRVRKIN